MRDSNIFYGEDKCVELFQEDPDFGWLGYVNHNTPELKGEYDAFWQSRGLNPELEDTAVAFMDFWEKVIDEGMSIDDSQISFID